MFGTAPWLWYFTSFLASIVVLRCRSCGNIGGGDRRYCLLLSSVQVRFVGWRLLVVQFMIIFVNISSMTIKLSLQTPTVQIVTVTTSSILHRSSGSFSSFLAQVYQNYFPSDILLPCRLSHVLSTRKNI